MGWVGAEWCWRLDRGTVVFQSLRGFGVGWSARPTAAMEVSPFVSIPERVWGGLEPAA